MLDPGVESKVKKEAEMRIGQLAQATGVPPTTLRYYDDRGLVRTQRGANGYRRYDADALHRVRFIKGAQAAGLTLDQISQVLSVRDDGRPPCGHVRALLAEQLAAVEQRLAELRTARDQLRRLHRRAQRLDPAECAPEAICHIIEAGRPGEEGTLRKASSNL